MPRHTWTDAELEARFLDCVRGTGRGLTYGKTVTAYSKRFGCTERSAKSHLSLLRKGMERKTVREFARYRGPEGWLYGEANDKLFEQAKADAELPAPKSPADSNFHLGGRYNDSPMSVEWTACPVKNRIVMAQVVTMGIADFMACPLCNWFHFLGVSPKMQDQRVYAWQIDPLVNAEEYADELSCRLRGDAKTYRAQRSRLERIQKGGHYVGLLYRSSWDYDPMNPSDTKETRIHGVFAQVPVRVLPPDLQKYPTPVRYLPPRPPNVRSRPRKKRAG